MDLMKNKFKEIRVNTELETLEIDTLEGTMIAIKGDFIIKGIKGEFYPCKQDIFKKSYGKELK